MRMRKILWVAPIIIGLFRAPGGITTRSRQLSRFSSIRWDAPNVVRSALRCLPFSSFVFFFFTSMCCSLSVQISLCAHTRSACVWTEVFIEPIHFPMSALYLLSVDVVFEGDSNNPPATSHLHWLYFRLQVIVQVSHKYRKINYQGERWTFPMSFSWVSTVVCGYGLWYVTKWLEIVLIFRVHQVAYVCICSVPAQLL